MAKIKLLPHHEICPQGATFETQEDESICEAALRNNIKIEHACEMSCACTTCHIIIREGTLSNNYMARRTCTRHFASMLYFNIISKGSLAD